MYDRSPLTFYPQIIGEHESEDGDALVVIGARDRSVKNVE